MCIKAVDTCTTSKHSYSRDKPRIMTGSKATEMEWRRKKGVLTRRLIYARKFVGSDCLKLGGVVEETMWVWGVLAGGAFATSRSVQLQGTHWSSLRQKPDLILLMNLREQLVHAGGCGIRCEYEIWFPGVLVGLAVPCSWLRLLPGVFGLAGIIPLALREVSML
eukprot:g76164.t1